MKTTRTMKTMEKIKTKNCNLKEQGITIVALVVTIIILLILAGVTINIALRENGLFKMAREGVNKYEQSATNEQKTLQKLDQEINILTKEHADKTSHVGWYASRDGKTVDGIIYADQAVGNTNGTEWYSEDGAYKMPIKEKGLKEYYISQEIYTTDAFGSKPVLTPISDEGEDRFYIMALEDFGGKGQKYYWYNSAFGNMSDYENVTSTAFGNGKTNTENMVAKWEAGANGGYGLQNEKDIWGYFSRGQIPDEWFLPSIGELSAFLQELEINKNNSSDQFQLSKHYWSSSQTSNDHVWCADVYDGYVFHDGVQSNYICVRLSSIF